MYSKVVFVPFCKWKSIKIVTHPENLQKRNVSRHAQKHRHSSHTHEMWSIMAPWPRRKEENRRKFCKDEKKTSFDEISIESNDIHHLVLPMYPYTLCIHFVQVQRQKRKMLLTLMNLNANYTHDMETTDTLYSVSISSHFFHFSFRNMVVRMNEPCMISEFFRLSFGSLVWLEMINEFHVGREKLKEREFGYSNQIRIRNSAGRIKLCEWYRLKVRFSFLRKTIYSPANPLHRHHLLNLFRPEIGKKPNEWDKLSEIDVEWTYSIAFTSIHASLTRWSWMTCER